MIEKRPEPLFSWQNAGMAQVVAITGASGLIRACVVGRIGGQMAGTSGRLRGRRCWTGVAVIWLRAHWRVARRWCIWLGRRWRQRWTDDRKKLIHDSRVISAELLVKRMVSMPADQRPEVVLVRGGDQLVWPAGDLASN